MRNFTFLDAMKVYYFSEPIFDFERDASAKPGARCSISDQSLKQIIILKLILYMKHFSHWSHVSFQLARIISSMSSINSTLYIIQCIIYIVCNYVSALL